MKGKKIGLVGGISWVSTLDYYRLINEGVNSRLGGLHFAELLIYSLNFADVQAATWEHAYNLLRDACLSLKDADATALALCANTAHLFADQLEKELELPLIHIVTETAKVLRREGHTTIGLLGTKFTMEMPFYRERLEAFGITVLTPPAQETRDYVQHTVKEELGRGVINPETKARYISIAQALVSSGATAVVLGCTEIPLLISQADFSVPVFDTVQIHSAAIVDYLVA
ncbi:aspartate/glutamate racemase family protein [Hymenobacter cellulosivorans]|uniref:Amino acid racemase n=1 Tax=Hymenobacter cellulosivorans TaxID=2932249 RepID=A0ABY4F608_9BACT|nr:amino acid racemase [Hymenobacter cellulosivorans]UOQ51344.1 amino acid racemase [Hymenobacter cellulosivorans]